MSMTRSTGVALIPVKNACSRPKCPPRLEKRVKPVEVITAKAVNAITDKRGHRTVCEHLCSWWAGRWRDRDIGSRYIYNDPICMQMAAYRTDLSHSYSYVTKGSVHVSFLLLFRLPLTSPSLSLSLSPFFFFSLSIHALLFLAPQRDSSTPQVYLHVDARAARVVAPRRVKAKCIDCA